MSVRPTPTASTAPVRIPPLPRLKAERIQLFLKVHPAWRLAPDSQSLRRTFQLASDQAAVAFIGWVIETARLKRKRLALYLSGSAVEVVVTATGKKVSPHDLAFCRAISLSA